MSRHDGSSSYVVFRPRLAASWQQIQRAERLESTLNKVARLFNPQIPYLGADGKPREVEGLSTAETAECLGISEELVKVRLHRAKSRLRKHVFARVGKTAAEAFQFYAPRCDRVVASVFERIDALEVGARGD